MKRIIPIIALIPLVILALTPPWQFALDCNVNGLWWLWAVLLSGFLAFTFLYQKVNVWLKLLVVWCFISSFLSRAPFISFTMFWSVIACAYYFVLCTKIEDFTIVKKTIQSIFFVIALLIIMQLFGKDTLLNFNAPNIPVLGTIGNQMILSSFVSILSPLLIFSPLNWIPLILIAFISHSSGAVLSLGAGLCVYAWARFKRLRVWIVIIAILAPLLFAYKTGDIRTFAGKAGRRQVWVKTIQLIVRNPTGYGIGTYKIIFPVLCGQEIRIQQPGREWNTAHNDWLQLPFEIGIPGFILLLGWIVSIVKNVLNDKNYLKLAGLTIVAVNMMVHFPGRMVQCALLLIMFLAYCSKTPLFEKG